jgi:beta-glucosidase
MRSDQNLLRLPPGFLWGVATAAHQNEGSNANNQWSHWEKSPGHILAAAHSGLATNWWDLETAAADFDRAADIGCNSLRLSVEWSRIEPEEGVFDQSAFEYYRAVLQLLIDRHLRPLVTLHHFTDPLWLTRLGGWENPYVAEYFTRFVGKTVGALGDLADFWCTINEPIVYAHEGYLNGHFPPGVASLPRSVAVLRNMLLAHGRAYRLIHALQNGAEVGLAHHLQVIIPANPSSSADRLAASVLDRFANRSTLEAITTGRLTPPLGIGQQFSPLIDSVDYIGLNYYTRMCAAFDPRRPGELFAHRFLPEGGEYSDDTMAGTPYSELSPNGLYLALQKLAPYHKPVYITENGLPDRLDEKRARYLASMMAEAWRATRDGVDLRGYYYWTLLDNFEWIQGWDLKFGLYSFDRTTQVRTPTSGAAVFQRLAQCNGVPRSLLGQLAPERLSLYFDSSDDA